MVYDANPSRRSMRALVVFALVSIFILLATFGAASAHAEDTFRFVGKPGAGFTAIDGELPECWSDASGLFVPSSEAAENGKVSSDLDIWDECGEQWANEIYYGQHYDESTNEWHGGFGGFWFDAEDRTLEPATLSCFANGAEWVESLGIAPIENMMSAEVDGTTCTVEWLPGAGPGSASGSSTAGTSAKYSHLVSSLAPVDAGKARVAVQTFGRRALGVEDKVTLRTESGRLIGQATAHLEVGDKAKRIAVPLDPATRRAVTHQGYLVVRASIRHVDGSLGAGDDTSSLVLRAPGAKH